MKRRLRKKLHRGEFNWLGFEVRGRFDPPYVNEAGLDLFADLFCVVLESHGLYCNGSFWLHMFEAHIHRSRKGRRIGAGRFRWHYEHCTQDDRDVVGEYLRKAGVEEYVIGPLKGGWT